MEARRARSSEHSTLESLISHLCPEHVVEAETPRARRAFLTVHLECFRAVLTFLVKRQGYRHLSTITAVDVNDHMEVIYHLGRGGETVSLRVLVPKDKLVLPTAVDLVPGAVLYEREVHELFGIVFEGHPDLRPLLLPDGWPEGLYPMRKNLSLVEIRGVLADARTATKLGR